LEAKKQVRIKYLEFLKATKNIDEVLQVQSEINNIQEEIEAAAGRVEYLSHQSALSSIDLIFYQPGIGAIPYETSPSFITRIAMAFKNGGSWIMEFLLVLISIWPVLLIATGGFFIYKRSKISLRKV